MGGQVSGPAGPATRRRKNHRGGKKKKSRRKSFAHPDDMVHEAHNEGLEGSEGVFYKSHNLSNTSIDSETLLDHR